MLRGAPATGRLSTGTAATLSEPPAETRAPLWACSFMTPGCGGSSISFLISALTIAAPWLHRASSIRT
jgi:hypothetical protein